MAIISKRNKNTIKRRTAVYISLLYSTIFGLTSLIIILLFASFRKDEFLIRLEEKAMTSIRLLLEVKEIDEQLLRKIDRNTINRLYNEKTLIYNEQQELIYSSVDDAYVEWNPEDLFNLRSNKKFHVTKGQYDIFGFFYDSHDKDYYVLIYAEDKYGNRKLRYLIYLLLAAFAISTTTVWLASFRLIHRLLSPLDRFIERITSISERNLTTRLEPSMHNDEIDQLANAFNQMMGRIETSYKKQQEFSSNASHELRTPVARLITQLENLEKLSGHSAHTLEYIHNLKTDANQMAELISSLLLLSRSEDQGTNWVVRRMDEVLFEAIDQVKKDFPDFQIRFEMLSVPDHESALQIHCNESLIKIALLNLLRNAYLYSDNKSVEIELEQVDNSKLLLRLSNNGPPMNKTEKEQLFQPFMRGRNAAGKQGTGLGLRIAQRIIHHHEGSIHYLEDGTKNVFEIALRVLR
jgi:two-component system, OmpR family, sensor histidine kinase ArlS